MPNYRYCGLINMRVAIVKYNAGNIFSVVNALGRIGIVPVITDDREVLASADRVLLPGQGEASNTMAYLREHSLDKLIVSLRQPVMGICIGQQLFCASSEEGGGTECLGVFPDVVVRKFTPLDGGEKVPHMGWNTIDGLSSPLMKGIDEGSFVYFVHSFYAPVNEFTIATTNYVEPFSAAMRRGNFFATQFHPEKSGDVGERILRNFIDLDDKAL